MSSSVDLDDEAELRAGEVDDGVAERAARKVRVPKLGAPLRRPEWKVISGANREIDDCGRSRRSIVRVARRSRAGGGAYPGKIRNPAPEMKKFKMMIASDVFTTARVVAQPTPSEPPNVESPQ